MKTIYLTILALLTGLFTYGQCEVEASFDYEILDGTVYFTNTSTGVEDGSTFEWHLGETSSTDENPEIAFDDIYTYPVVCFFIISEDASCDDSTCVYIEEFADSCDMEVSFEWVLDGDVYYFTNTSEGEDGSSVYQWSVDGSDWSDDENPTLGAGDIEGGSVVCLEIYDEVSECDGVYCFEFPEDTCEAEISFEWVLEDGTYYFTNTSTGVDEGSDYSWSVDGTDWSDDEHPTLGAGDVEDGSEICLEIYNEETDCGGVYCVEITVEEEPCELLVSFTYEVIDGVVYFTNTSIGEGDASVYSWWADDYLWSDDENPSLDLDELMDSSLICFEIYDEITECSQMSCYHIDLPVDTTECIMVVDFDMSVTEDMVHFTDMTVDAPSSPIYSWTDDGVEFSALADPIVPLADIGAESDLCLKVTDALEVCSETTCIVFFTEEELGIDETNNVIVELFPNPANEMVQIVLPADGTSRVVEFYNSVGQRVFVQNVQANTTQSQLDISTLSPGLYSVMVRDEFGNAAAPVRFVKQ